MAASKALPPTSNQVFTAVRATVGSAFRLPARPREIQGKSRLYTRANRSKNNQQAIVAISYISIADDIQMDKSRDMAHWLQWLCEISSCFAVTLGCFWCKNSTSKILSSAIIPDYSCKIRFIKASLWRWPALSWNILIHGVKVSNFCHFHLCCLIGSKANSKL